MATSDPNVYLERSYIEELIFGGRKDRETEGVPRRETDDEPRRYRFTQDSPVLPDVWIRYGSYPAEPQDLLLTPRFGVTAGEVSRKIRVGCVEERKKAGRKLMVDVAYNQTYVVARLYFDELIRVVLPMTRWWQNNVSSAAMNLMPPDIRMQPDSESDEPISLAMLNDPKLQRLLTTDLDLFEQRNPPDPDTARRIRELADLLWMIRIVGSIAWAQRAKRNNKKKAPPNHKQVVRAIAGLVGDLEFESDGGDKLLWQVNLNRPAGAAIERSTLAVKADAARLLFDVKCSEVAWAVVDSGIDASHPAFWNWQGNLGETTQTLKAAARTKEERRGWKRTTVKERLAAMRSQEELSQDDRELWAGLTRVTATYDFTRARTLFNSGSLLGSDNELVDEEQWPPFVRKTIRRARMRDAKELADGSERKLLSKLHELAQRLDAGRGIDWSLAQPFLAIPHDDAEDAASGSRDNRYYERPSSEHGTHVAGILGADWPQEHLQGMCPDIKLYDMRVIDPSGVNSDEFAVLSALQFIGYLNDQKDLFAVHGVNMSLSIRHDVANFACGRTPACDECERLVSSGVVVVAAAGNHGYLKYKTSQGVTEGYNTVSITDPGNAEGVITVGSTHRSQPHTYGVSYFSSRGPTGDGRLKPDLVAPGERIEAPVPNYGSRSKDGTSMAAPHVSGAAAMLLARHSELIGQPKRIKDALLQTATDLGRERYFQGCGMLDVLRALQSV